MMNSKTTKQNVISYKRTIAELLILFTSMKKFGEMIITGNLKMN